jgi:predicted AAA+ superfamily ATPase
VGDAPNRSGGSRPAHASLLGEPPSKVTQPAYAQRITRGGYPEVVGLSAGDRRVWFDAYVRTTVSRDILRADAVAGEPTKGV